MADANEHNLVSNVKVCVVCGSGYRKKKRTSQQWAKSRACSHDCMRVLANEARRTDVAERFWSKVDKTPGHGPNGDCWPWIGALLPDGYGHFRDGRKVRPAHVVSYEMENGPLPPGMNGLHSCDYRRCVNPGHIFAGTHQDNMNDMVAKGRGAAPKGEAHHDAKLTEDQVRAIRDDPRPNTVIAAELGVTKGAIWLIKARRNWRHVE